MRRGKGKGERGKGKVKNCSADIFSL